MQKAIHNLNIAAAAFGYDNHTAPIHMGKKKEPQSEESKKTAIDAAEAKRNKRAQKRVDLLKKAEERNVEQQELRALLLNLSND